nr:exodeoxyribonuclease V subunit alpha [Actinomycetota bacterium]
RLFGGAVRGEPDRQREAALLALTRRLAVVAGGPGTGKTRTVARVLVATEDLAARSGRRVKVALAAPTGKAAARLTESVRAELVARPHASGDRDPELPAEASTIHRLLGGRPDGSFARDARDRLPHDLVVVDETSMVSLPLMARLLDAVRPDASVMLVGDPFQLASVEAGAVLGEIVGPAGRGGAAGPLAGAVVRLERVHRFGAGSALAALADAIRDGDTSRALALARDGEERALEWVDPEDHARLAAVERSVALQALDAVRAARDGDAAGALSRAGELKVLCAANAGQLGVTSVTARVEQLVSQELPGAGVGSGWYAGRPVVVSENDYGNRLFNGDVGITMLRAGRASVVFPGSSGLRAFAPSQLPALSTWWATTVHKAQGSEFERVVVMLPPPPSPVLTRELLYTAVTRSRASVTVVASEESWRAAISHPVARASGLGAKLWPTGPVRP